MKKPAARATGNSPAAIATMDNRSPGSNQWRIWVPKVSRFMDTELDLEPAVFFVKGSDESPLSLRFLVSDSSDAGVCAGVFSFACIGVGGICASTAFIPAAFEVGAACPDLFT